MYNNMGADLNLADKIDLMKAVSNKEIVKQVVGSNCVSSPCKPFVRMSDACRNHLANFVRNRILNKDYTTISQLFDCILSWCKWTNCEVSFKWYASNYAAKYKGVTKAFYKAFHAALLDSDLFLEDGKVLSIPSTSDGNWVRSGELDTGMDNCLAPRKCYDVTNWESCNTIESCGTVYDLEEPYHLTIEQQDDRSFVIISFLNFTCLSRSCGNNLLKFRCIWLSIPFIHSVYSLSPMFLFSFFYNFRIFRSFFATRIYHREILYLTINHFDLSYNSSM